MTAIEQPPERAAKTIPNEPDELVVPLEQYNPAEAEPILGASAKPARHLQAVPEPAKKIPHEPAAEMNLLGAAMLSRDALETLVTTTSPADFYVPAHAHIAQALTRLWENDQHADPVMVADILTRAGLLDDIGGIQVLKNIMAETPATTAAASYASTVRHRATLRAMGGAAAEAEHATYALNVDSAVAHLETAIGAAIAGTDTTVTRIGDRTEAHIALLEARTQAPAAGGVPTGWTALDRMLGGLRPGQLITIAGRPAMGKTAVAGQLALNACHAGRPTLFASIEMGQEELHDRFVAALSGLDSATLRDGHIPAKNWPHIIEAEQTLNLLDLYIDDNVNANLRTIAASARRIPELALVIVDYVQLMQPTARRENRQVEVTELAQGLKRLARTLRVPVVALAQLNRNLEGRGEKRPQLSDLRESGAIEQESDVVIGLYRDDYYKPDTKRHGILEVIVLKHRAGGMGTVDVQYELKTGRVRDLATEARW